VATKVKDLVYKKGVIIVVKPNQKKEKLTLGKFELTKGNQQRQIYLIYHIKDPTGELRKQSLGGGTVITRILTSIC